MSELETEPYKDSFERMQRMVAFLVHKAGGEVVVNQGEFLYFPRGWEVESTLDTQSGGITLRTRFAK